MSEENEESDATMVSIEEIIGQLQENMVKTMNEAAAKGEGMKSLTDKEIADYLRNEAPYIVEKIYRALKKDAGPINTSDMTPLPLPMKFMTRALSEGAAVIQLNFSGGSDEGHLHIDFRNDDGRILQTYNDENRGLVDLDNEISTWVWDTHNYNGAGDGRGYGDVICYNLKEGTVTTECWWTDEIYGGKKSDTMETC